MSIKFACPKCSRKLGVADRLAGKRGRCPRCSAVILVPIDPFEATEFPPLTPDQTNYDFSPEAEAPVEAAPAGTKRVGRRPQKFDGLIQNGLLTSAQLVAATAMSAEAHTPLDQVLMTKYGVKREDLGKVLSDYYKCSLFRFEPSLEVPRDLVDLVEREYLEAEGWCPIGRKAEAVLIAIEDPRNLLKHDDIRQRLGVKKIVLQVAMSDDLHQLIDHLWKSAEDPADAMDSILDELKDEEPVVEEPEVEIEEVVNENDSAIVKLVNKIIADARAEGASDIHIEPNGNNPVTVRYRIDGECVPKKTFPGSHRRAVISRIKVMADLDIAEHRRPQDGKIRFRMKGTPEFELRVACYPTTDNNEDVVLRLLTTGEPLPLSRLGLSESNFDRMQSLVRRPYGLLLVVGPTGSGKTTTLHSVLGHINRPDIKILTAEDPIEITQPGLRQVQVHQKIGFTFAAAMRSFLRADPDVIMIGEMRDQETAAIAIEASLTGHMVFSTLHTNTAPDTVVRLLDMGLDPFTFSDSLLGVLAQRLVRSLCPSCRVNAPMADTTWEGLMNHYGREDWGRLEAKPARDLPIFRKGAGCNACMQSGYRGRMAIHELLPNSDAIRAAIQRKKNSEEIRRIALDEGMRTLKQDGIEKVMQGLTDLDQVLAAAER